MDDKVKFQAALAALQSRAEEHGGVLNIEEMQDYLKDMEFSQEQLGMISAYLTGKGIHVEGAALPEEEKALYGGGRRISCPVQKRTEGSPPSAGRAAGIAMAAGTGGETKGQGASG